MPPKYVDIICRNCGNECGQRRPHLSPVAFCSPGCFAAFLLKVAASAEPQALAAVLAAAAPEPAQPDQAQPVASSKALGSGQAAEANYAQAQDDQPAPPRPGQQLSLFNKAAPE